MTLQRYRGALPDLFPPDEESAPWLVRLAMIRHDLSFEVSQLGLNPDDDNDAVFRTTYFLRRMTISILEAENILSNELGKLLKRERANIPAHLANALNELRATVTAARPTLEAVRDIIGAHLRPKNDDKGNPTLTRAVLRQHDGWTVDAAIDLKTGRHTNLRDVAIASFFFAWPDVKDDADFDRKHGEYQAAILPAARSVMHATDALLFAYWSDLGIPTTQEEPR